MTEEAREAIPGMTPIARVKFNSVSPMEVLAQTIAHEGGWHWGPGGQIFDHEGVWLANSLTQLATVIAEQTGWFQMVEGTPVGITWPALPQRGGEPMDREQLAFEMRRAHRHYQEKWLKLDPPAQS